MTRTYSQIRKCVSFSKQVNGTFFLGREVQDWAFLLRKVTFLGNSYFRKTSSLPIYSGRFWHEKFFNFLNGTFIFHSELFLDVSYCVSADDLFHVWEQTGQNFIIYLNIVLNFKCSKKLTFFHYCYLIVICNLWVVNSVTFLSYFWDTIACKNVFKGLQVEQNEVMY